MRINGVWFLSADGAVRPAIQGEVLAADGTWLKASFLVDSGADRTVLSADVLRSLRLPSEAAEAALAGVGGEVPSVLVDTQIRSTDEEQARVVFRGRVDAFTDVTAMDLRVLGRDILNLFAVIVDHPRMSFACSSNRTSTS
jgi:hypothetical protein